LEPKPVANETYRRAVELLEADINDELVALEPSKGACFGFNSVAKDVWRKLERPRTFEELRNELLSEYEVSEDQCTEELRGLLEDMSRANLIERTSA
jgi:hypothetical protein